MSKALYDARKLAHQCVRCGRSVSKGTRCGWCKRKGNAYQRIYAKAQRDKAKGHEST